jgi:hypothetical protein
MKQVRLFAGEGDNKVEIGVAETDPIENGDIMVNLTITDPKVAELLGGTSLKGVIPRPMPSWVEEPVTPVEEEPHE